MTDQIPVKLSDYEGADCRLYRTPSVTLSYDSFRQMRDMVVKGFMNESSAPTIIGNLQNSAVVDELANKLEESLSFQRESYIASENERLMKKSGLMDAQKETKLTGVAEKYAGAKSEVMSAEEERAKQLYSAYNNYSQVATTLKSLRERVQEKLDLIGGVDNLEKLLNLNSQIMETDLRSQTRTVKKGMKALEEKLPDAISESYSSKIIGKIKDLIYSFMWRR